MRLKWVGFDVVVGRSGRKGPQPSGNGNGGGLSVSVQDAEQRSDIDLYSNPGAYLFRNLFSIFGSENKSGKLATTQNILAITAAFACIRRVSSDMASLPKGVFRVDGKSREELRNHPVSELISDEPNGLLTSYDFFEWLCAQSMIHACAYALIERQGSVPVAIWPLNSLAVDEVYTGGTRKYLVRLPGHDMKEVQEEDMLRFPAFYGQSVVTLLNEAFGLSLTIQHFAAQFFANNGNIARYVKYPGPILSDKNKQDQLAKAYGGKLGPNSKDIPIIGDNLEVVDLKPFNMAESQQIETRKFQGEDICRVFGVPPTIVGYESGARYNSVEMASTEYVMRTLLPRCVQWEQELKRKLLKESEKPTTSIKFMLQGLMRGDSAARSAFYTNALNAGWLTPNDIRGLEEMPAIDGGDELRAPLNSIASKYYDQYSKNLAEKGSAPAPTQET